MKIYLRLSAETEGDVIGLKECIAAALEPAGVLVDSFETVTPAQTKLDAILEGLRNEGRDD